MSRAWFEWVPFGAFVYGLMFGIVLVPVLITGYICLRYGKSRFEKAIGLLALLTPLAGAGFYTTLDYFDSRNKYSLWWILILIIHLLPLVASSYVAFKNRRKLLKGL